MNYTLLILAVITAVIEWVAVGKRNRKVEYFAKPAVIIFVLAWLILSGSLHQYNLLWFTVGMFFSLLGDVFLLMRREQLGFKLGLSSFLLAQICYIIAFNTPLILPGFYSVVLAGPILALVLWFGWRIFRNLNKKGLRRLSIPVFLYILTIGTMLFSALGVYFGADWKFVPAILVGLGALSFTTSDMLLAWNKFIVPIRYGRVLLMITYHLGQIVLAVGFTLQFLP